MNHKFKIGTKLYFRSTLYSEPEPAIIGRVYNKVHPDDPKKNTNEVIGKYGIYTSWSFPKKKQIRLWAEDEHLTLEI